MLFILWGLLAMATNYSATCFGLRVALVISCSLLRSTRTISRSFAYTGCRPMREQRVSPIVVSMPSTSDRSRHSQTVAKKFYCDSIHGISCTSKDLSDISCTRRCILYMSRLHTPSMRSIFCQRHHTEHTDRHWQILREHSM